MTTEHVHSRVNDVYFNDPDIVPPEVLDNAHAIAKAGRPFCDKEWMCALDEKGLDVGASCRTDKKCCEFITALQKSSWWVCMHNYSQTTSLSWWMALLFIC